MKYSKIELWADHPRGDHHLNYLAGNTDTGVGYALVPVF
jgi:hypothetical protein